MFGQTIKASNGKEYKLVDMAETEGKKTEALTKKGFLPARYKVEDAKGRASTAIKKTTTNGGEWVIEFHGGWIG